MSAFMFLTMWDNEFENKSFELNFVMG